MFPIVENDPRKLFYRIIHLIFKFWYESQKNKMENSRNESKSMEYNKMN